MKAILTPLKEELSILVAALEQFELEKRSHYLGNLEIFEFHELDIIITLGGHGKTQFGIQAQHLLCHLPQLELLVCAGAAGALSNSLQIGDIVVATETVEHDYHLKFVNRPLPRFLGDNRVIDTLQNLSETNFDFVVHFGPMASGDEDIIDTIRGQRLNQLTGCIAVAWEGAGGARACQFSQKRYLEIRGITDTADHNAATDFTVNLSTAMNNLVKLILQWQNTAA